MKKEILFAVLLFAGVVGARAQMLSPEVVASSGEYYANATGQLSWTAGETVVETFSGGGYILTQGFQQPVNLFTTAVHRSNSWMEVKAYPNPTYNILNIYLPKAGQAHVKAELFDVTGKVIYSEVTVPRDGALRLDLSAYENGMYLLKLSNLSGTDQTILRIQKAN